MLPLPIMMFRDSSTVTIFLLLGYETYVWKYLEVFVYDRWPLSLQSINFQTVYFKYLNHVRKKTYLSASLNLYLLVSKGPQVYFWAVQFQPWIHKISGFLLSLLMGHMSLSVRLPWSFLVSLFFAWGIGLSIKFPIFVLCVSWLLAKSTPKIILVFSSKSWVFSVTQFFCLLARLGAFEIRAELSLGWGSDMISLLFSFAVIVEITS